MTADKLAELTAFLAEEVNLFALGQAAEVLGDPRGLELQASVASLVAEVAPESYATVAETGAPLSAAAAKVFAAFRKAGGKLAGTAAKVTTGSAAVKVAAAVALIAGGVGVYEFLSGDQQSKLEAQRNIGQALQTLIKQDPAKGLEALGLVAAVNAPPVNKAIPWLIGGGAAALLFWLWLRSRPA